MRYYFWRLIFTLCCSLCALSAATGATLIVTNENDNLAGSLRQAIQDANPGDTIVFNFGPINYGIIYLESGELVIDKNLTIDGAGAKVQIQRQNNGVSHILRIFHVTKGTVVLANLQISYAQAPDGESGGGILNSGNLTLRNCTVNGNYALGQNGGGIANATGATLALYETTISGNSANSSGNGGGIWNASGATVTIESCTIAGNAAEYVSEGSGIYNADPNPAAVRIHNTIVALNTASPDLINGGTPGPNNAGDVVGAFTSGGYNFIGDGSSATGFGGSGSHDQVGNSTAPADPKLGPLGDNGGPTQTMRPISPSPVIDQGSRGTGPEGQPLATDQRGYARTADQPGLTNAGGGDGTDIGAVEFGLPQQGPTFTVNNLSSQLDNGCLTDLCTLPDALAAANGNSDANVINFEPGLASGIDAGLTANGFLISGPVTINGPGARRLYITGGGYQRIFQVAAGAGSVNISGLTLENGNAAASSYPDGFGGAILNKASLSLTDCTLLGNGSKEQGGAIYNDGTGAGGNATLNLTNCTLAGNTSTASGGAIFSAAYGGKTTVNLTNCTFDTNTAAQYGGAIYNDGTSSGNATMTVTNCTFNGNSSNGGASGIHNDAYNSSTNFGTATVKLRNAILRSGGGPNLFNDGGTIVSQGHNLSSDAAGGDGATGPGGFLNAAGDKRNTDPLLSLLANNGGPTDTAALLSGSPAINAGDDSTAPSTDQRGYYRSGVSDIGAFELNGIAPVPPAVTTGPATNITSTTATLNATVNPDNLATTLQFTTDFGPVAAQDIGSGASNVSISVNVTGLTPNTQYYYTAVASNTAGATHGMQQTFATAAAPTPVPTPTPTPTPTPAPPSQLLNLSTRKQVGTGDNVLIGGFIVVGIDDKKVLLRGLGPSLANAGVSGALADPVLELHAKDTTLLAANDNWHDAPNASEIAAILPPSDDLESAILTTLPAKAITEGGAGYTGVLSGKDGTTGIGLLEIYDLDTAANSKLANISTRGFVGAGDDLLIGGFIPGPSDRSPLKVLVRALGPSLTAQGVDGALQDPVLELHDPNGILLSNDNWKDTQQAEIEATGAAPTDERESALIAILSPSSAGYTAVVRGANGSTGVALVEIYALN